MPPSESVSCTLKLGIFPTQTTPMVQLIVPGPAHPGAIVPVVVPMAEQTPLVSVRVQVVESVDVTVGILIYANHPTA